MHRPNLTRHPRAVGSHVLCTAAAGLLLHGLSGSVEQGSLFDEHVVIVHERGPRNHATLHHGQQPAVAQSVRGAVRIEWPFNLLVELVLFATTHALFTTEGLITRQCHGHVIILCSLLGVQTVQIDDLRAEVTQQLEVALLLRSDAVRAREVHEVCEGTREDVQQCDDLAPGLLVDHFERVCSDCTILSSAVVKDSPHSQLSIHGCCFIAAQSW